MRRRDLPSGRTQELGGLYLAEKRRRRHQPSPSRDDRRHRGGRRPVKGNPMTRRVREKMDRAAAITLLQGCMIVIVMRCGHAIVVVILIDRGDLHRTMIVDHRAVPTGHREQNDDGEQRQHGTQQRCSGTSRGRHLRGASRTAARAWSSPSRARSSAYTQASGRARTEARSATARE